MRILYHKDALVDIFSGNRKLDDFERSIINTCNIVITNEILTEYHRELGEDQIYQDWISSLNNHRMIENIESAKIKNSMCGDLNSLDHYDVGSYYSDQEIISLKAGRWWKNNISLNTALNDFVSRRRNVSNPYKTIVMENNGHQSFDLFQRYLKVEKEIYIYDQYINIKSKKFLDYIFNNTSDDSFVKIFLFEETGNCMSAADLNREFNSPRWKFYKVTPGTAALIHDRFINFGKRIQVTFSKGLDQFNPYVKNGLTHFDNKDSVISFFDLLNSDKSYEIMTTNETKIILPKRY